MTLIRALSGKTTAELRKSQKFHDQIENLSLPVTVLRIDLTKQAHWEYLFIIFHRLNTGGEKLTNQEIRNCIFGGSLNDLLKELDENLTWRQFNRMKPESNHRKRYQELILRFFAFTERRGEYRGVLSKFLNDYMQDQRSIDDNEIQKKETLFTIVVSELGKALPNYLQGNRLSVTLLEGLLIGSGVHVIAGYNPEQIITEEKCMKVIRSPEFSKDALKGGLSKKDSVDRRINVAIEAFKADD